MLVHTCENCKQMKIWGYENELAQFFCNEECYKEYCEKNNYEPHLERLYKLKTIF